SLFQFTQDYFFYADQLTSDKGQTVTGTALDAQANTGLEVGLGTLRPTSIRLVTTSPSDLSPVLYLSGRVQLHAIPGNKDSQKLHGIIQGMNLDFSSAGAYGVTADARGAVNIVAADGANGAMINWTGNKTFTVGPLEATVKAVQFGIDTTNKKVFLG